MLRDFHEATAESLSGRYDVCVMGTGPAGMTVAMEVANAGGRVLLLEAGGLQPTNDSQSVYQGTSVGDVDYQYHIATARLRYFGGTSMHWAGLCGMFDEIDFEQRPVFGLPGWPISRAEVYTFQERAKEILGIEGWDLDARSRDIWNTDRFVGRRLANEPPRRFGTEFRDVIASHERIDCLYHANAVDMTLSESGDRVTGVTVRGYGPQQHEVSAERFVVAFGALETPRFLLNARSQMPNGIGNQNDMVGRTFMEHFMLSFGRVIPTDSEAWSRFDRDSTGFHLAAEGLRGRNISNCRVDIGTSPGTRYYGRTAFLKEARRDLICRFGRTRAAAQSADPGFRCPGDGTTSTIGEHLPNLQSRVGLDESQVDRFGNRRLYLAYNLRDDDRRSIRETAIELGKEFASTDVGRLRVAEDVLAGTTNVGVHAHHMGTTRMSASPKDGVVDTDCKVHGIDNLYIGGSSVFATGGAVNPTFTLVSLAVRLGKHLSDRIGRTY